MDWIQPGARCNNTKEITHRFSNTAVNIGWSQADRRYPTVLCSIIHVIRLKSLARFNDIQPATDIFSPFSPRMDRNPLGDCARNIRQVRYRVGTGIVLSKYSNVDNEPESVDLGSWFCNLIGQAI